MKTEILEKTSEYLGAPAHVASKAATKAASVVADGAKAAKDAAVRGYNAAETAVSVTGRQIRRKPVVAVLSAMGAGFVIGLVIGRTTKS